MSGYITWIKIKTTLSSEKSSRSDRKDRVEGEDDAGGHRDQWSPLLRGSAKLPEPRRRLRSPHHNNSILYVE
jgi:hypothetical protein